ncbi:hypothetical protein [Roseomonas sp. BN140053]|uniref:hypothetical protein n=1 Tax=Roseomonas sp. BN140053 TaxID=3391898 RepID=UPI0039EA8922
MERLLAPFRGLPLLLLASPLLPALLIGLADGQQRTILGTVFGLAGTGAAVALLRRNKRGDRRRAAALLGVGVGLAANFAAGTGPLGGVVLGLAAGFGARFAYAKLREPPPEPVPPRVDPALDPFNARLRALDGADRRLTGAVAALRELLGEMTLRPNQAGTVRGVLVVGLDGLERIAQRLERGAAPTEGLDGAVGDVERAARDAAARLRAVETEALDVQVNVLRQRLREEGMA